VGALGKSKTVRAWVLAGALALAGTAAAGEAVNPDGRGWLKTGGAWSPAPSFSDIGVGVYSVSGFSLVYDGPGDLREYHSRSAWEAEGCWPLLSSTSLRLGFRWSRVQQDQILAINNGGSVENEELRQLDLQAPFLGLSLYPAAFFKDRYQAGPGVNPDGWAWWPSLDLDGELRKTRQFFNSRTDPEDFEVIEGQEAAVRATLPLPLGAPATLWASYEQAAGWSSTLVDSPLMRQSGGAFSRFPKPGIQRPQDLPVQQEAVGLRLYFAPRTPGSAWSAHLGPAGQWGLDLALRRAQVEEPKGMRIQTRAYEMSASRAFRGGLQLGLGYQLLVDDGFFLPVADSSSQPYCHSFLIQAGWSWGLSVAAPEPVAPGQAS